MNAALIVAAADGAIAGLAMAAATLIAQRRLLSARYEKALHAAKEKVIRQLSHDIRSPLSALETVLDNANGLSAQDRALIATSATRMRDIANTLAPSTIAPTARGCTAEPLQLEIEFAVSQYRSELRAAGMQRIDVQMCHESFSTAFTGSTRDGLYTELSRAVSHLTHAQEGPHTINVRCAGPHVELRHVHTGDVRRFTPVPALVATWFTGALAWRKGGTIVITDDDEAVHAAWQKRIDALPPQHFPTVVHFKSLTELHAYANGLSETSAQDHVWWVDQEFNGHTQTGLEAIKELKLGHRAVLCTSHYDDNDVRLACEAMGAKLLPKTLLHSIPLAPRTDETIVLIDDDTLVHQVWRFAARRQRVGLRTFLHPDEFMRDIDAYDPQTRVYIDARLGNGVRGEDVARAVSARGFANIYITTGSDPSEFPPMPYVKDILGKDPPF